MNLLLVNGGTIDFHGGFAANGAAVARTIQVLADSTLTTRSRPSASAGEHLAAMHIEW